MSGMISVFLQKDGTEIWLELPTSRSGFQKAISGINAPNASGVTIGQYKTSLAALSEKLLLNADINLVNYLAAQLLSMDEKQFIILEAIMESPFRFTTLEQFIEYPDNEDCYLFRHGINGAAELGRYYVYDTGLCQMPEEWKGGIDLEKFGEHAAQQEGGAFTSKGYIMSTGDKWKSVPLINCIPENYCLI